MKYCKNCGNQASETADFCMNCGARLENGFKPNVKPQNQKSSGAWKIVLIICITLVILAAMAIAGLFIFSVIDEVKEEIRYEQWENTYEKPENYEITTYDSQKTVTENDLQYSLKNIEYIDQYQKQYPTSGYQFLIITIEIKNLDDETIGLNPNQFMIENEYGNLYQVTNKKFETDDKDRLQMITLKPSEVLTKKLIYEVKSNDKQYYLNVYEELLDLDADFRFQLTIDNKPTESGIENTI